MSEINCAEIVTKYFYIILALIFVLFAVAVMIFKYFLKWSREGIELKQADKQHDLKHGHNEKRIKKLEEKNGHEDKRLKVLEEIQIKKSAQIELLKKEIEQLKKSKISYEK